MASYPTDASELTPELLAGWLGSNDDLRGVQVRGLRAAPVDQPGQGAQNLRVHIDYAHPTAAPRSLIAKFAAAHGPIRDVADGAGYYRREVRFYRELATEVGLATPRCYFADYDNEEHTFLLLLEDLADGRPGSFDSSRSDLEMALSAVAAMHARWWESDRLAELRWAPGLTHPAVRAGYFEHVARNVDALASATRYHVSAYVISLLRDFLSAPERVLDKMLALPPTLVHGDYQPLNVFYPRDGVGRFAVIDWQVLETGFAGCDLARMIVAALPVAKRRAEEATLLDHYREVLDAAGARIEREALDRQYELGILSYVLRMVPTLPSWDPTRDHVDPATGERFTDVSIGRLQTAAEDRDVARWLRG